MSSARVVTPPGTRTSRAMPGALPGPLVTVEHGERVVWGDDEELEAVLADALASRQRSFHPTVGGKLLVRVQAATVVPMVRWVIQWRTLPPSQNEIMRRFRTPQAYDRLLASWRQVFGAAATTIPRATGRRRLEITRFVRDKNYRLDRGNLVGGCKPLLDAAVHAGLLIDDREDHLDDHYDQRIDPVERVQIAIADMAASG